MMPGRQTITYNPRKSRGTSGEAIRRLHVKRGLDRATPARSGVILLCFALELVYSGFNVFFNDLWGNPRTVQEVHSTWKN